MNLENSTSFVLRHCSALGVSVIIIGLLADLFMDAGVNIAFLGIAVIVFTPFAGLLVSFTALSVNKEKKYALAAFVLIALSVAGMLAAAWM